MCTCEACVFIARLPQFAMAPAFVHPHAWFRSLWCRWAYPGVFMNSRLQSDGEFVETTRACL
eukprot:4547654-Alexandrium_andersonii.AAC.3